MNGSRVETIENALKEYKQLLEEGWRKIGILEIFFRKKSQYSKAWHFLL